MRLERVKEVVQRAEDELRSLVAEAAKEGDYATVVEIAAWASQLARLVAESGAPGTESTERHEGPSTAVPIRSRARRRKGLSRKRAPSRPTDAAAVASSGGQKYPTFVREGSDLVKIAWSKTDRNEYEHRAPWRNVEAVASALARAGSGNSRFTMDDVIPVRLPASGDEVPSYQAYAVLAWLRHEDLVIQYGRRGYSVAVPDLESAVAERWVGMMGGEPR